MKKIFFIFSALYIFTLNLFAKDIEVFAVDSEIEIPLEGVSLSINQELQIDNSQWFTDEEGYFLLSLPDELFKSENSLTISAYLPGYAIKKVRINSQTEEITLSMSISFEEVLEGKELVVEQQAYQKTDAESGISVVVTKDQFDASAQIGSIPDIMTTIKTLPGVTYMGSFSQQPSIRGAYPYEMACIMDGTYIYSPFHWNGGVSIFDPMFIKSVKLSHGIFSARNGHSTAGLLDITTVEPEDETVRFNASISDVITDGIIQIPFSKKAGFVGGYRISYYDTIPWLYDHLGITKAIIEDNTLEGEEVPDIMISDILQMPSMKDFYGKFYYNPTDRIHISITEFLGIEKIGLHLLEETKPEDVSNPEPQRYSEYSKYSKDFTELVWKNVISFGSLSASLLPFDNLQINLYGGYNNYDSIRYIDFLASYHSFNEEKINSDDDNNQIKQQKEDFETTIKFEDSHKIFLMQGKASAEYFINESNIVSCGFEEFYKTKSAVNIFNYTYYNYNQIKYEPDLYNQNKEDKDDEKLPKPLDYTFDGNRILNSVAYASWEFGNSASKLKGEAGLRLEHYYIYNKGSNVFNRVKLGTVPTINPRVSLSIKPEFKDLAVQDLTFSAGAGIFSLISDSMMDLTPKYEVVGKLKPDQNVFAIVGSQFSFLDNYSFQIEAYYKYYLSRYYASGEMGNSNYFQHLIDSIAPGNANRPVINKAFCDGTGHVFGFDSMLQKKYGRYLDGYLTYSFVFARYLNPYCPPSDNPDLAKAKTDSEDPLGKWYYPYFHRFHTFSAVINYRPVNGLVLTLTGAIVSGVPVSNDNIFAEIMDFKNDRTAVSFPVNFRIGLSDFYKVSKLQYEWYFGIENMLGLLNKNSLFGALFYMARNQKAENLNIYSERLANFDIGLPTLSIGLRISM